MHWRDGRRAGRLREAVRSRALVAGLAALSLSISATGAFLLVPGVDVDRVPGSRPIEEVFGFDGPSASAAEAANHGLVRSRSLGAERADATVRRVRAATRARRTGQLPLGGGEPTVALVGAWTGTPTAGEWTAPLAPPVGFQPGVGTPTGGFAGPAYPDTGPGYPDTGGVVPDAGGGEPPTAAPGSGGPGGGNEPDPVDEDDDEDAREEAEEAAEEAREAAKEAREKAREAAEKAREEAEEAAEEAREEAEEAEDSDDP